MSRGGGVCVGVGGCGGGAGMPGSRSDLVLGVCHPELILVLTAYLLALLWCSTTAPVQYTPLRMLCRGFDVDGWRAHLNALTWPEVARQLATAAGLGRRRPKPKKEERVKMGQEGEDTVRDDSGE